jgi:hypothetical protein
MAALISVIMPCFNAGPMLRPALNSVLRQSHPDIEVIFVDNNSTDGSADVAREVLTQAGRPFAMVACPEQGVNRARNLGYTHARGDFIQWMDADDGLSPDKLALQVAALEADPRADIAYGDWSRHGIETGLPDLIDRFKLTGNVDHVLRTLAGVWYPPHLYLLRRAAAERLQDARAWFPERPVATDVEYSAIAALLGMRFLHVTGAHVRYNRWSKGQISNATRYARRVASLEAIFQRLRVMVESGEAQVEVSARHKVLLYQGWDVVRMAANTVSVRKLPGRRFVARRLADGREIELRPREAAVTRMMAGGSPALVSLHHALALAERVPEVAGDHVAIVRTIDLLRRGGFLERVAPEDVQPVRQLQRPS